LGRHISRYVIRGNGKHRNVGHYGWSNLRQSGRWLRGRR
jgi:hypothetical protein